MQNIIVREKRIFKMHWKCVYWAVACITVTELAMNILATSGKVVDRITSEDYCNGTTKDYCVKSPPKEKISSNFEKADAMITNYAEISATLGVHLKELIEKNLEMNGLSLIEAEVIKLFMTYDIKTLEDFNKKLVMIEHPENIVKTCLDTFTILDRDMNHLIEKPEIEYFMASVASKKQRKKMLQENHISYPITFVDLIDMVGRFDSKMKLVMENFNFNDNHMKISKIEKQRIKEVRSIHSLFGILDSDGNHSVTLNEYEKAVTQDDTTFALFEKLDLDKSGEVDFIELSTHIMSLKAIKSKRLAQRVSQAFRNHDDDKDGFFSQEELLKLLTSLKGASNLPALQEGQLNTIFRALDTDKDGRISTAEVKVVWSSSNQEIFLMNPTRDTKMKMLFKNYDIDLIPGLSQEELSEMTKDLETDGMDEPIDSKKLFEWLDEDSNRKLEFNEFYRLIEILDENF